MSSTLDKSARNRNGKSPDAFRTISEVAEELGVPQHVLRFWESKFNQIKPLKRGGGRRYYRPEDVLLLRGIRRLLYEDGYTIKGVQKVFRDKGIRTVVDAVKEDPDDNEGLAAAVHETPAAPQAEAPSSGKTIPRQQLEAILSDLSEIRRSLTG